jgi:hypothetical protein
MRWVKAKRGRVEEGSTGTKQSYTDKETQRSSYDLKIKYGAICE